jgi:hypothetical protein
MNVVLFVFSHCFSLFFLVPPESLSGGILRGKGSVIFEK